MIPQKATDTSHRKVNERDTQLVSAIKTMKKTIDYDVSQVHL